MERRGCIPHAFLSKSTFYILGRPKVHPSVDNATFLLSCSGFEFTQISIIQQTYNHLTCFHFSPLMADHGALRSEGKSAERLHTCGTNDDTDSAQFKTEQLSEDGNVRA